MQSREMTESEQRALREGLRMVARLIARHHLAQVQTVAAEPGAPASADLGLSAAQNERHVG